MLNRGFAIHSFLEPLRTSFYAHVCDPPTER